MSTTPHYIVEALVQFIDVPSLGIVPVQHYVGGDLAQAVSALTVAATSYEGANRELRGVKMTVQQHEVSDRSDPVGVVAPRTAFLADTSPLLEDTEVGTKYVGPLEEGKMQAHRDFYTQSSKDGDKWVVVLMRNLPASGTSKEEWDAACFEAADMWGRGDTEEEAYRYALGALFGPIDAQYDEDALRSAIADQF